MRSEERSVDATKARYRRILRRSPRLRNNPMGQIEFLLQLVGTRTAIAQTYVAAYRRVKP